MRTCADVFLTTMQLITDWKSTFTKLWSVRLALLTAVFSALEVALPFFVDFVPPRTMAILATASACGSAIARIVAQPALHKD